LPVFADSDLKTFQLDPDDIEHRITKNTRALMPVHIYGLLPIWIKSWHRQEAQHSRHRGRLPGAPGGVEGKKVGTLGTLGCFSFQESKVLPGGEAGALVSDDEELIAKAYRFRNFGVDPKTHQYATRASSTESLILPPPCSWAA